jgi:hypothetical protein
MAVMLALVPTPAPEAVRVKKPNRRKGSIPSKVTDLRPRQTAGLSEKAIGLADFVIGSIGPESAAEVAECIRLSLLQAPAS